MGGWNYCGRKRLYTEASVAGHALVFFGPTFLFWHETLVYSHPLCWRALWEQVTKDEMVTGINLRRRDGSASRGL